MNVCFSKTMQLVIFVFLVSAMSSLAHAIGCNPDMPNDGDNVICDDLDEDGFDSGGENGAQNLNIEVLPGSLVFDLNPGGVALDIYDGNTLISNTAIIAAGMNGIRFHSNNIISLTNTSIALNTPAGLYAEGQGNTISLIDSEIESIFFGIRLSPGDVKDTVTLDNSKISGAAAGIQLYDYDEVELHNGSEIQHVNNGVLATGDYIKINILSGSKITNVEQAIDVNGNHTSINIEDSQLISDEVGALALIDINGAGSNITIANSLLDAKTEHVLHISGEAGVNNIYIGENAVLTNDGSKGVIQGGIGDELVIVEPDGLIDGLTSLGAGNDTFIGLGVVNNVLLGDGNDELHIFTSATLVGTYYEGGVGIDTLKFDGMGMADLNFSGSITGFENWIVLGGGQWQVGGTAIFENAQVIDSQLILEPSSEIFIENGIVISDSLLYVNGLLGGDSQQATVIFNDGENIGSQLIVGSMGVIETTGEMAVRGNNLTNYVEINTGGLIAGDVALLDGADTVVLSGKLFGELDLGAGDDAVTIYTSGTVDGLVGGDGYDTLTLLGAGPGSFNFGNSSGLEYWSTQGGEWMVSGGQVYLDTAELLDGDVTLETGSEFYIQNGFILKGNDNALVVNGLLHGVNNAAVEFAGNGELNRLVVGSTGILSSDTPIAILGDDFANSVIMHDSATVLGDVTLAGGNDIVDIGISAEIVGHLATGDGEDYVRNRGILNHGTDLGAGDDYFIQYTSGTFTNLQGGDGYDVITLAGSGQSAVDFDSSAGIEQLTIQDGGTWDIAGTDVELEFAELLNGHVTLVTDSQFTLQDTFYIENSDNTLIVNGSLTGIVGPAVTFKGSDDGNKLIVGSSGVLNSSTETAVLGDSGANSVEVQGGGQINGATLLADGDDEFTIGVGAQVTGLIDMGAGDDMVRSSGITHEVLLGEGDDSFVIDPNTQLLGIVDAGVGYDTFGLTAANHEQQGSFDFAFIGEFEQLGVEQGDWLLTGAGDVDVNFTGGRIRIAEGDILSITGDYVQAANTWLDITVSQEGIGGLVFGGSAHLDGGLKLRLADPDVFIIDRIDIVFLEAAGGISGEFAETDIPQLFPDSLFLSQALEYNPTDVRLSLYRSASYESVAVKYRNPRSVASYLDHLLTIDSRSDELTDVLRVIDFASYEEFQRGLNALSSEIYDAVVVQSYAHGHGFMRTIRDHARTRNCHRGVQQGVQVVCQGELSMWVKGVYQQYDRDGRNPGYVSFDTDSKGVQGGVDYRLGDVTVGLSAGYTRDEFSGAENRGEGEGNSYDVSVYADWDVTDSLYVTGVFGYGQTNYDDIRRSIDFSDIRREAEGESDLSRYFGRVDVGYRWRLTDYLSLDTSVGLEYQHVNREEIEESGAGSVNLVIEEESYDRLSVNPSLELEAAMPMGAGEFTGSVRLGWLQHLEGTDRDLEARFEGAGADSDSFRIHGEDDEGMLDMGVDLGYRFKNGLELGMSYDRLQGSDSEGDAVGAYLNFTF